MTELEFVALFGGQEEDYGPCTCGARATIPVAIPMSWIKGKDKEIVTSLLESNNLRFAMGYDYRRVFGPVKEGEYLLNFSACPECCERAEKLGIAKKVDDVGFSSNALAEGLLDYFGK